MYNVRNLSGGAGRTWEYDPGVELPWDNSIEITITPEQDKGILLPLPTTIYQQIPGKSEAPAEAEKKSNTNLALTLIFIGVLGIVFVEKAKKS